jgi:hypothetical protein
VQADPDLVPLLAADGVVHIDTAIAPLAGALAVPAVIAASGGGVTVKYHESQLGV